MIKAAQEFNKRCFTCTVKSHYGKVFSWFNSEIHIVDDRFVGTFILEGNIFKADFRDMVFRKL